LLLDGLIGAFILSLGAAAFYSMFPIVQRSNIQAQHETRAVQMSSRLIEHLQLLKPENLNGPTLIQLNLVEPGQNASPYSISRIPLDEGSMYSPAQVLPQGQGRLILTPLAANSIMAEVEISWMSGGTRRFYRTGTVVGGYR
jgi:hypothetical protein